MEATAQDEIDRLFLEIDRNDDFSNIGGNTAEVTMGDAGWKGRTLDIQDHLILPIGCFWESRPQTPKLPR